VVIDTPVTNPDPKTTVATEVLLLLQVPPVVPSVNAVVSPEHTLSVPPIATGSGLTDTVPVMLQPVGKV